jgi:hypothetical protein
VAELLAAREKRLIRSGTDALEGVVAAIEQYALRLRHENLSDLDNFWNRPRKGLPTPKEEERASEIICAMIHHYFSNYAVGAEREVQICRRLLSKEQEGIPGSKVDVLCRVPPATTADGDAISVPIEVKLSHNPEARTGLRDQLVERYMRELNTNVGVFVLVWMDMPRRAAEHRPLWNSAADARKELDRQAEDAMSGRNGTDIRVAVIDASLPITGDNARKKHK